MRTIEQVLDECKTIDELQAAHQERDAEVQRLRREQGAIHDALEPLWMAQQMLTSAPANLAQRVEVGKPPVPTFDQIAKAFGVTIDELKRRLGL